MALSGNGDERQRYRIGIGEKLDGKHAAGGRINVGASVLGGPVSNNYEGSKMAKHVEDKDVEAEEKGNPGDRDTLKEVKENTAGPSKIDNFKRGGRLKRADGGEAKVIHEEEEETSDDSVDHFKEGGSDRAAVKSHKKVGMNDCGEDHF